jgi:hypothetical protein
VSTKNTQNKTNKSRFGGRQPGAGRPETGVTKTKKCVSVTTTVWQDALKKWKGKGSELVDLLLKRFVAEKAMI